MHKTKNILEHHPHIFNEGNKGAERNAWIVFFLTVIMMAAEILGGWMFGSMALLADGWHMSTHALALGITAVAYLLARRYTTDKRFAFGTWKIEILGGYTSAILLGFVALYMAAESVRRFYKPHSIQHKQAIVIAVFGLIVNIVSALILKGRSPEHPIHQEKHFHHQKDLNIHAAYVHVLSDALTSVLAIIALFGDKYMGWRWLDPLMGIVGAVMIGIWMLGLLNETGNILLDRERDEGMSVKIRKALEADGDSRISDLHVWRVGRNKYACIVAIVSSHRHVPEYYKRILRQYEELAHITIEINSLEDIG
ncbi:MAG TPA: CDF family Co(II)/Ni(II) efflux transporter DmeF [Candidatus Sumerlaeota bacterium]|nr:CDF family Co(II)/Ni(II) efflux transporter DmeF [Candidatus Sumerlaeota bacterium]HON51438.1 CDF family Co(II)/Ni(II) efflux transporter DmeF [Candidatus Sumerlaeota bacterium]HOR65354.1 CDF family Co(II)/Ni(II) efflux transporter DmeF [Candidatus Sumerlaeota bacterium]HPL74792.1 CDF family Co(II)/Ni(II) efflux transporter DmeF [Candidatus Sumerlaeota bacterium]HRU54632.1 CDF family Co(II)/Ni(II) efflux transporter DmeF [Candidatus Sumerlaeia bacterium]